VQQEDVPKEHTAANGLSPLPLQAPLPLPPQAAAEAGHSSAEEDLPVSSPLPSSYAALSDSYLSPDRLASPKASAGEGDGPCLP
jgi:hypothetical protein